MRPPLLSLVKDNWEIAPLWSVGKRVKTLNSGLSEKNLLSLSYGNIVRRDIEGADGLRPASYETYQIIEPGDTIFRFTDLQNDKRSLRSAIVTEKGIISSAYLNFRVRPDRMDPLYFSYLMRCYDLNKVFYEMGSGVRQSLNYDELSRLMVPTPPLDDQRAIVAFLDRETAQIDAMVEAQKHVLVLAEEHRKSFIAEEIDRLPEQGYPRAQLRHCVAIQTGVTLGKKYGEDAAEYPYLRVANVQAGHLDLDEIKTVKVSPAVADRSTLKTGDVLITEGGDRAALGRGALWRDEIPGALHQNHIFALRCKDKLDPEFLVYALDAPSTREYFEMTRTQTTNLSSTNSAKVKACKIPLPPVEIQRNAVHRLHSALNRIDQTIAAASDVITLLRERREALITTAVTGRIDPHTGVERVDHPDHADKPTLVNV